MTFIWGKSFWISFVASITLLLAWSCPNAYAQEQSQQAAPKPTKRTTVDFEDQLVQGEVKKPELFYLLQKKQFNFGKLIKLRENFVPEMTQTAEDIEKTK
ncbi:MAG: hypothetical protein IT289_00420 [Oligoflexia bacterium]|nr:hypothetical protein [Oligoflexia bacterium]